VIALLKRAGALDISVFGGGIISDEDAVQLKKAGIKAVFTPGTPLENIVNFVRKINRR
jgi:methylmalonyl-CoA mutase C-terminal domain/subunit